MSRELHLRSHPSPIEHWRHLVEIVALIAAAIWAFYVFIYQEQIKPAGITPQLQPVVDVTYTPIHGGREFVKVTMDMKHSGGAPLVIAGMVVNVYGIRYEKAEMEHVEKPIEGVTEISYTHAPSRPKLLYTFLDTWHGFGAKKHFGPLSGDTQSFSETLSFVTDRDRYDAAKATWQICWSRPSEEQWAVAPARQSDGSFWFPGVNGGTSRSDLHCTYQSRGAFFPL